MDALVGTSLVAAFIAGVAALFAPCCVTVLLPSYLGNVFRERYRVFAMTFVFFLGIATVFLPIGLGASALAQVFSRYHNAIFAVGGVFLVFLGIMMLLGKKLATPVSIRNKVKQHVSSVYLLGIFSAIATTCCAPVLAGVLTLSVASGTIIWGTLYTLAYILGMTLPLFLIAALIDRTHLTERWATTKKTIALSLGSRQWQITISELISGLIFLLMGGYITYLASRNALFAHSSYQLEMNIYNAKLIGLAQGVIKAVPEAVWAVLFLGILAIIVRWYLIQRKTSPNEYEHTP